MTVLYRAPEPTWINGRHYGFREGDAVALSEAEWNTEKLTDVWALGAERGIPVYFPPGIIRLSTATAIPSNLTFRCAGRGLTIFKSHPDYIQNGPIFGPIADAGDDLIEVSNTTFSDFTVDGDFLNNTEYLTRLTTVSAITPASTTVEVSSTVGFTHTNRVALVPLADTTSEFTYTSYDDTHFYGVAQTLDGSHTPWSADPGTEMRPVSAHLGLMRVYSYENLVIERVTFKQSYSYNLAGEGRPYDSDPSHVIKKGLTLRDVRFEDSYASDGIDVKDQNQLTATNCVALRAGDKGFNVRGRNQAWVNCTAIDCRTGFGLTTSQPVADAERVTSTLNAGCTATDTTITLVDASEASTAGSGWIDAERISWTGTTATTLTGVTRGLEGTRAAAHLTGASFAEDWPVDDQEATSGGMIDMLACHVDNCSTGVALSSGSPTHANMTGGTVKNCGLGVSVLSTWSPMHINMTGVDIYENQTGAKIIACRSVRLNGNRIADSTGNTPADPGSDVPGDGLTLEDCSNGAELYGNDITGNAGVGIRTTGNTDYVELHGKLPYGNAGNPIALVGTHNRGSMIGYPSRTHQPRTLQEAAPLSECASTVNLTGGTVLARCFTADGPINVTYLWTHVTTASTVGISLAKFALAEVNGDQATIVAVSANTSGGWWSVIGDRRITLLSPTSYRLETGKRYAVLQLAVGATGPPVLAARAGRLGTNARRLIEGATAGTATDLAVGNVLTLTATAAEPYVAVEVA